GSVTGSAGVRRLVRRTGAGARCARFRLGAIVRVNDPSPLTRPPATLSPLRGARIREFLLPARGEKVPEGRMRGARRSYHHRNRPYYSIPLRAARPPHVDVLSGEVSGRKLDDIRRRRAVHDE